MNTNQLKKFAQEARRKLLQQVGAKLEYVLTHDTAELREKATQIQKLKDELNRIGKQALIDKVAYTWFNRLMALRFMDVNDYQPSGIRIVSPKEGYTLPQILDEAKQGHFPEEIAVNKQKVLDVLDGRVPSSNPQNEAYRYLLIAACNALHQQFPFLFERINDYTELLLPDDLTSEFSILHEVVEGMSAEDCREVEIIGWLYQFYISERKDELINAKKRYKAEEIAPVTQLFTPKWIVQYMVDNTLGQYWKEARPNTKITQGLEFYIEPHNSELIPSREVKSPEDIKFFDPCVGSAHVLCYAFDIFYKMYEEEGYNPADIPKLILSKNLYGIDIDDRAAQLAGFALMMKGRQYHRRFLKKQVTPNITSFQNINSHPKFENAKVLGSLIKISQEEVAAIEINENSLFSEQNKQLKNQASLLSGKYDIVVTNPPYLNSGYMEGNLKQYIEKEYKETKSDLFACFLVQASNLTNPDGLIGFICPYVWMFIKSYEWLREFVIGNNTISSLIQLEYNAFGPAVVPIGTFVLRNQFVENYKGSYVKLSDFRGVDNQAPKTLEAIQNPNCGWFYTANQKDFEKIPGSPIGYWVSKSMKDSFIKGRKIEKLGSAVKGLDTGYDEQFLRMWSEVAIIKTHILGFGEETKIKWFKYKKGGAYRKWYGNYFYLVNWENDGVLIKNFKTKEGRQRSRPQNLKYYFKKGLEWSRISSSSLSLRLIEDSIFGGASSAMFLDEKQNINYTLAVINSKIIKAVLEILNPTLVFQVGDLKRCPVIIDENNIDIININVENNIDISKKEWDSKETSWDFQQNELLRHASTPLSTGYTQDLEETYDLYKQYWKNKFHQLQRNEEELNRQFIEIYGLEDELTPDVPLEDITILKEETKIENGQLVFQADEVFKQFMSYAVGCMFGRYSLDKEGLVLANQGETVADYVRKVLGKEQLGVSELAVSGDQELTANSYDLTAKTSFMPDEDAIIPVLDDEWFEDDVVGRFYEFLRVTFGKKDFQKNLTFLEEQLGKDVRKYFVKDFYNDHIKRYKKRPIYWLFSSPKGAFNVLVYLHRYTPDTINNILNNYLREFIQKLKSQKQHFQQIQVSGSTTEQNKATKEIDKLDKMILDCEAYERDILYPRATERIAIDLDDGVLVNYNKLGKAVKEVNGLNDKGTKKKVRGFDWIDVGGIRD